MGRTIALSLTPNTPHIWKRKSAALPPSTSTMNLRRRMHLWPAVIILLLIVISTIIWFHRHPYAKNVVYDFPLVQEAQRTVDNLTGNGIGSAVTVGDYLSESGTTAGHTASPAVVESLPPSIRIQVPFMTQAPKGNWDLPYQEACEEASLILLDHYLQGKSITADQMDKEIVNLVKVENDTFGYSADITIEQLSKVAKEYLGYDTELFYDFTIDDMKSLLAAGHPIIVPLAGRDIGNPHYRGQGPWYHMLVITGYDAQNFVTNDVGTRVGEGYEYPYHVLFDAIHDWNNTNQEIHSGRRVMMIVKRKE